MAKSGITNRADLEQTARAIESANPDDVMQLIAKCCGESSVQVHYLVGSGVLTISCPKCNGLIYAIAVSNRAQPEGANHAH